MIDINYTPMKKVNTPLIALTGTLIVFHGRLPNLSGPNESHNFSHSYALHVIEGRTYYSKDNWLQRNQKYAFKKFLLEIQ